MQIPRFRFLLCFLGGVSLLAADSPSETMVTEKNAFTFYRSPRITFTVYGIHFAKPGAITDFVFEICGDERNWIVPAS